MNIFSAFRGHLLSVEGTTLEEAVDNLTDAIDEVLNQQCTIEEYEEEWEHVEDNGAISYLAQSHCTVTIC